MSPDDKPGLVRRATGRDLRQWRRLAIRAGARKLEAWERRGRDAGAPLAEEIDEALREAHGWCTPRKAHWLAQTIIERRARAVIEIGVFGGRSLIPMALAVKHLGGGTVVGVEPWAREIALAEATDAQNDAWWSTVDFAAVKEGFFRSALRLGVCSAIKLYEMDSAAAFDLLERQGTLFDLVHIDGAHSPVRAYEDAVRAAGRVKPGGLVVLDDIVWPSVAGARQYLCETLRVVEEVVEDAGASYGAYEKV